MPTPEKPLLSILIPTYNRSIYLYRLLSEIHYQLAENDLNKLVEVVIGDNHSTDDTLTIANRFVLSNTNWKIVHNSSNIGPDANMLSLLRESSGVYRWFIGDDDLPIPKTLALIIQYLNTNSPSLIYIPSKWSNDVTRLYKSDHEYPYISSNFDRLKLPRKLNIRTTFISSWIFNAEQLPLDSSTLLKISALVGTNLIQLGWILPLIAAPYSIIASLSNVGIFATAGNSGGYAVARTFLVNYAHIVSLYTTKDLALRRNLICPPLISYIPRLLINLKCNNKFFNSGTFAGIFQDSCRFLWPYPSFWIFCVPILVLPRSLLFPVYKYLKTILPILKKATSFRL